LVEREKSRTRSSSSHSGRFREQGYEATSAEQIVEVAEASERHGFSMTGDRAGSWMP
jgi:hypothetical protein